MRNLFLRDCFSQYSSGIREINTAWAREGLLHCLNDDLDMIWARTCFRLTGGLTNFCLPWYQDKRLLRITPSPHYHQHSHHPPPHPASQFYMKQFHHLIQKTVRPCQQVGTRAVTRSQHWDVIQSHSSQHRTIVTSWCLPVSHSELRIFILQNRLSSLKIWPLDMK